LAEHARLSVQAVGALERGDRRAPRKETVDLLAEALGLSGGERAAFADAAREQRFGNVRTAPALMPIAIPLETPSPAEDGLPPPFDWRPSVHVIYQALSSTARGRGRMIAGLVLLVTLGTSLLAGSHALPGGGVICLATDFPASGIYSPSRSVEDAVNLAVLQNQHLENGNTLKVINYDDAAHETRDADPGIGADNVRRMIQDRCIVAAVGPGNSNVAVAELPIAAYAGLVMVSPSTTLSGLTLRPYAELEGWNFDQLHPAGKPVTFFRIAPNNVAQSLVAANYTFDDLKARNVYVVNDREPFGEDLVGGFTQSFQVRGGRIAGIDSIPSTDLAVIAAVAAKVAAANPDAVYYAGSTEGGGGPLKSQLTADGYTGPFVGGEGIADDPGYVQTAGVSAANGTLAVAPVAHPSSTSSAAAAKFIRTFHARYPVQNLDPDSAEAYDAAMVLITAIKRLLAAGQPVTREAMIAQVQHMQYAGVIGPISFDANGDIAHGIFSLYHVQNGAWTFIQELHT
jgi:branched-chain amino acid transport system substrate-binding protein